MKHSTLLTLLTFLLLTLATAPADAAGRAYGKAFVKKLNATPEQEQALIEIRDTRRANARKADALTDELYMLTITDDYDKEKAAELSSKLAETVSANAQQEAQQLNNFYMSLNDEQKAMWHEHENRGARKRGQGSGRDSEAEAESEQ